MERVVPLDPLERSSRILWTTPIRQPLARQGPRDPPRNERITYDHLVDENAQRPPVDGRSMTGRLNDLGSDIL